jgi:hypothetical protein
MQTRFEQEIAENRKTELCCLRALLLKPAALGDGGFGESENRPFLPNKPNVFGLTQSRKYLMENNLRVKTTVAKKKPAPKRTQF